MKITYKTNKLERACTEVKYAEKTYGFEMAVKLQLRIKQITAANNVEELIDNHVGRCHPLSQNRKGQYALDLIHPKRLVFEVDGNEIQIANIIEIVDYH